MMSDMKTTHISFSEVCLQTGVAQQAVIEIVEHGIVEPQGASPDDWYFSPYMVAVTRKAVRLHRDLKVDWAGIALALELLEEVEQLREENRCLQSRLNRFVEP